MIDIRVSRHASSMGDTIRWTFSRSVDQGELLPVKNLRTTVVSFCKGIYTRPSIEFASSRTEKYAGHEVARKKDEVELQYGVRTASTVPHREA